MLQSAGDSARIETEWLDSPGDWCLDLQFRLQNAKVYRRYEFSNGGWGYTYTYSQG